eukprot:g3756.t1
MFSRVLFLGRQKIAATRRFADRSIPFRFRNLVSSSSLRSTATTVTDADLRRQTNARWASAIAVMVTLAMASGVWAKLRRKQVKGWVLRVFDTFDMLDLIESLQITLDHTNSRSFNDTTAVLYALSSLKEKLDSKGRVSFADARSNPLVKSCLEKQLDLCVIFAEDEQCGFIDFWTLVYGTSILYILSRPRPRSSLTKNSDISTHQIMLELILACSKEDNTMDQSTDDLEMDHLCRWLGAAALLGVVRAKEYMLGSKGSLMPAPMVSAKILARMKEENETEVVDTANDSENDEKSKVKIIEKVSSSQNDTLKKEIFSKNLSLFDYSMFHDRNSVQLKAMDMVKQYEIAKEYGRA